MGLLGVATALSLWGCNPFGPSSYRYKMTIVLETPDGIRAFSTVRSISYSSRFDGGYNGHARGQALIMDLPGGPVFALMRGADGDVDYAATIAESALEGTPLPNGANRDYEHGGFAEIFPTTPRIRSYMPKNPLPLFVRFQDINDPRTVERVDPASIGLRRITLEKTRESMTSGIEDRLPWWKEYKDRHFDGTSTVLQDLTTEDISAALTSESFSTEFKK